MNKRLFPQILIHLIFCGLIILFFRLNTFLRPAPLGALYKEYIVGVLVLSIFYLNYFLLYPKFYEKRRFGHYLIVSLLVLTIASLVEEWLVYPQVYGIIKNLDLDYHRYFLNQTGMIYLRDSCFFLFSFMLCTIRSLKEDKRDLYRHLQDQKHLIVAKDIQGKNNVTLDYEDITYCQQEENYAYLYLMNGKRYYRNNTLSDLSDDIGPACCVRISRNVVVMYAYVQSFDQNTVFVQTYDRIKGFNITNYYKENALLQLQSHVLGSKVNSPKVEEKTTLSNSIPTESLLEDPNVEQFCQTVETEQVEKPQTIQQVLVFISAHPGCKNPDIAERFRISQSTVNRILKQLKEDGLITYEGSKKTGGYRVVSS